MSNDTRILLAIGAFVYFFLMKKRESFAPSPVPYNAPRIPVKVPTPVKAAQVYQKSAISANTTCPPGYTLTKGICINPVTNEIRSVNFSYNPNMRLFGNMCVEYCKPGFKDTGLNCVKN